ncbi:electron transfer flavoprotein subunit alpha [Desulfurella acetivorans A63]|nr:electron transfer flavoprotein subunit alpha [Desulfurella acetivorans A63]
MKALLIGEYKNGHIDESFYELVGFANKIGADSFGFAVAPLDVNIEYAGKVYIADISKAKEYNPKVHKNLILKLIEQENPDIVVFSHSSYGWDLAPRLAAALKVAQISEIIDVDNDEYIVPFCNAKLRRKVKPNTQKAVLTLQAGAFSPVKSNAAQIEPLDYIEQDDNLEFQGFEITEKTGVDLTKAEVIVSAGRGVGKKENIEIVRSLAKALKGELGASRPVVDAGWLDPSYQVGTTGQTVAPKLYIACGISGAIQHLAGMKKSNFIVAINKDKDAPIAEVADVFVVADLLEFVPVLTSKLTK